MTTRFHGLKYGVACLLMATFAQAQAPGSHTSGDALTDSPRAPRSANLLRELDSSLETLVAKVSPAVVQIMVTGYGPVEEHGHDLLPEIRTRLNMISSKERGTVCRKAGTRKR